jgi:hypothetical protein
MTLSALGIFSAAGAGGAAALTDYELIETQILSSSTPSITFSSLGTYSSTYKHLQVRYTARSSAAVPGNGVLGRLNGVTSATYAQHFLYGNGATVQSGAATSQTSALVGLESAASATANIFGAGVIDLLDAYSTTKNKTLRTFTGVADLPRVDLHSSVFINTASITSFELRPEAGNFVSGSRFSLYGIKG